MDSLLKPVKWCGIRFEHGKAVSQMDGRKVLAHLNEIEFRWELATLDAELFDWDKYRLETFPKLAARHAAEHPESPPMQPWAPVNRRWVVVNTIPHFEGYFVPDTKVFYKEHRGFACRDVRPKVQALFGLARVMDEWKSEYRVDQAVRSELERLAALEVHVLLQQDGRIKELERCIAEHYIRNYKDVFSRAPVLPHATCTDD